MRKLYYLLQFLLLFIKDLNIVFYIFWERLTIDINFFLHCTANQLAVSHLTIGLFQFGCLLVFSDNFVNPKQGLFRHQFHQPKVSKFLEYYLTASK